MDLLTFLSGALVTEEQKKENSLYNVKKRMIREHLIFIKRLERMGKKVIKKLCRENNSVGLNEDVYSYFEYEEFQQLLSANQMNLVERIGELEFTLIQDSKERKHRLKRFTDLYARSVEIVWIESTVQGYKVEYKKLGGFFPNYTHTLLFDKQLKGLKYQLHHPQWKTIEEDLDIEEFIRQNDFNKQEVALVSQILKENVSHD